MQTAHAEAAHTAAYAAANAAHMVEEFLEDRLGRGELWEWLMHFPSGDQPRDLAVEDEVDQAILALQAYDDGTRPWHEVHQELLDCRSRLTGLARF